MNIKPNKPIEPRDVARGIRGESPSAEPTHQFEERLWVAMKSKIAAETIPSTKPHGIQSWFHISHVALGTVALVLVGIIGFRLAFSPTPATAPTTNMMVAQNTLTPPHIQYLSQARNQGDSIDQASGGVEMASFASRMIYDESSEPFSIATEPSSVDYISPSFMVKKDPGTEDVINFFENLGSDTPPEISNDAVEEGQNINEEVPTTAVARTNDAEYQDSSATIIETWEQLNEILTQRSDSDISITLYKDTYEGTPVAYTEITLVDARGSRTTIKTDDQGIAIFDIEPYTPEELKYQVGIPENHIYFELYVGSYEDGFKNSTPLVYSILDQQWIVIID